MTDRTVRFASLILALGLSACGGGAEAPAGPAASTPLPAAPGPSLAPPPAPAERARLEIVLQLRPAQDVEAVAEAYRLQVVSRFGQRPIHRLRTVAPETVDDVLPRLLADPRVLYAEANRVSETPESRRGSVWAIGEASAYTDQWAPRALGLDLLDPISRGAGVRIAILDTGVDLEHPALRGRLLRDASGRLVGRDFVDGDAIPQEGDAAGAGYGHGTHVAGLAARVAPEASILPIRVLDASGQGNHWVLAEALLWAVDPDGNPATDDGAHVINLSLGGLQPTRLLEIATRLSACDILDDDDEDDFADRGFDADRERCRRRHGAVVVAAAGNGGSDTERHYPAAEAATLPIVGALAVTASNERQRLWSGANRGPWVQLAAPGENITSAIPAGRWGTWSGTSMAAPFVAGSAALLIATAGSPDPQAFAGLRRWAPGDVARRLIDRSAALCDGPGIRQLDTGSALADRSGRDPVC